MTRPLIIQFFKGVSKGVPCFCASWPAGRPPTTVAKNTPPGTVIFADAAGTVILARVRRARKPNFLSCGVSLEKLFFIFEKCPETKIQFGFRRLVRERSNFSKGVSQGVPCFCASSARWSSAHNCRQKHASRHSDVCRRSFHFQARGSLAWK